MQIASWRAPFPAFPGSWTLLCSRQTSRISRLEKIEHSHCLWKYPGLLLWNEELKISECKQVIILEKKKTLTPFLPWTCMWSRSLKENHSCHGTKKQGSQILRVAASLCLHKILKIIYFSDYMASNQKLLFNTNLCYLTVSIPALVILFTNPHGNFLWYWRMSVSRSPHSDGHWKMEIGLSSSVMKKNILKIPHQFA